MQTKTLEVMQTFMVMVISLFALNSCKSHNDGTAEQINADKVT
jgi:uncharacterized protein YcfL